MTMTTTMKTTTPTTPTTRRGAALLMVLIAMMLAVTLGVTFMISQSPSTAIAENVRDHASARLIAESGLTTAIEYLRNSDDWRSTQPEGVWLAAQDFGGGSFRVMFEDADGDLSNNDTDPVRVTVVGQFGGVTHQVSAWVTLGSANGATPGLLAKHFHSAWYDPYPVNNLSELDDIDWDREPEHTETVTQVNVPSSSGGFYSGGPVDYFGVSYTGYITIPEDGDWTFYTDSDDGSDLWIDGQRVVENDGLHSMRERSGDIELEAGTYPFYARFFERTGGAGMIVRWRGPGVSKQVIPASAFTFDAAPDPDGPGLSPQLLALYEFNEIPIYPNLVGHWRLDETGASGGGLAIGGRLYMYNNALIDGYDASAGAYGGDNVLTDVPIGTNSTGNNHVQMYSETRINGDLYVGPGADPDDVIDLYNNAAINGSVGSLSDEMDVSVPGEPSGMPGQEGNQTYNGGNHVWNSDRKFARLTLNNGATITVDGHVRVAVNAQVTLNNGTIIVPEGSSLELYVGVTLTLNNNSAINPESEHPDRLSIFVHGNGNSRNMTMNSQSVVAGRVHVANNLTLNNDATIYGSVVVGNTVTMHSNSAIHLDRMQPSPVLGIIVRDSTDRENHGSLADGQVGLPGQLGRSYRFDGDDDYAVIPHHDDYLLDAGTLSLWFRTEDRNKNQSVFSKDHLNLGSGGHLTVIIEGGAVKTRLQSTSETWPLTAAAPISNNTWHHMVFTWGPNKMRLYLDGNEIGDAYNYIGGTGATSGGAGNFEPIVLGADARHSDPGLPTPLRDFFRGQIDDVRLYDQALDLSQVTNVRAGNEPGPSSFPGYIVEDTSGFGEALHLTVQDTDAIAWADGGGLMFTDDTIARSDVPATKLHDAITATGSFTLEAVFTPDNLTQNGPARIVNVAASSSSRNFMLGQDGYEYAFRLRTSDTSSNGTPDINSPGGLAVSSQHVVITANGEEVRFYRNGNLELTEARTGSFNWDDDFDLIFGGEADDSRNWRGLLSRVAIYDRALAASQVDNLFDGLPPGDAEAPGGFSVVWTEQP